MPRRGLGSSGIPDGQCGFGKIGFGSKPPWERPVRPGTNSLASALSSTLLGESLTAEGVCGRPVFETSMPDISSRFLHCDSGDVSSTDASVMV